MTASSSAATVRRSISTRSRSVRAMIGTGCVRRRSAIARILQFVAAVFLTAGAINAATPPSRILFIGNSYTSVNNLPELFKRIVRSAGYPIPTIEASTPGGLTLEQQAKLPATLGKIDEGNWDAVIIP